MKVHTIKLEIAMMCSLINFVVNNRVNKKSLFCCRKWPSLFPEMQARLWSQIRQGVEYGESGYSNGDPSLELETESGGAMFEPQHGLTQKL